MHNINHCPKYRQTEQNRLCSCTCFHPCSSCGTWPSILELLPSLTTYLSRLIWGNFSRQNVTVHFTNLLQLYLQLTVYNWLCQTPTPPPRDAIRGPAVRVKARERPAHKGHLVAHYSTPDIGGPPSRRALPG